MTRIAHFGEVITQKINLSIQVLRITDAEGVKEQRDGNPSLLIISPFLYTGNLGTVVCAYILFKYHPLHAMRGGHLAVNSRPRIRDQQDLLHGQIDFQGR